MEMLDAWEQLSEMWKDHEIVLIADVDCSDETSHKLCDESDIDGYPTMLYGDSFELSSYSMEYDGGYELEDLNTFVSEQLTKPRCSLSQLDACEEAEKAAIAELQGKSNEDLLTMEEEAAELIHQANLDYEDELDNVERLRANVETGHREKIESIRTDFQYKFLRQVLAAKNIKVDSEEL